MRLWFIDASGLVELVAAAVSGLIFYERIIVSLLPTVKSVPFWWWGLAASPLWIAALLLGWHTASVLELGGASLAGAAGSQIYLYWASVTHRPGLANQPLADTAPLMFWTVGSLVYWGMLSIPYVVGYMGRRLLAGQTRSQLTSH